MQYRRSRQLDSARKRYEGMLQGHLGGRPYTQAEYLLAYARWNEARKRFDEAVAPFVGRS